MGKLEDSCLSRRKLIHNGLLIAAGGMSLPGLLSEMSQAQSLDSSAAASSDVADRAWTIANDEVSRTVTFKPQTGLFTETLVDLKNHTNFILPGRLRPDMAQEFSFVCNGKTYTGGSSSFALVSANKESTLHGKLLTIRLRNADLPLEVSVIYEVYEGHPAIRKHLVMRNTGSTVLRLSNLDIEALALSVGPENETILKAQYGAIPREIFYTGRSEDAGLLIASGRIGAGIAILSEVPGYMKRTEINGWDDPERVGIRILYDTDLMPFERSLAAGEEFKTASVSLVTFRNGDGFRDPHWVLPSYTAKILMRRVDAKGPPWIYNTWEPFQRGINREIVLSLIEVASIIGIDIFTIDDGWQQEYGENDVNLTSFPGGLAPLIDIIEAKGMRLGLWIPMATIGTSTADYRNHREWSALDQQGKSKVTDTAAGSKVVMCLASPFRDAAAARINQAIDSFHLAYVKLDLTTIFNAYGEAPGCWAKGHYHGNWAESLNMIYEGIAYVTSKIYQRHPDVLLDLTFELWGQKHVIDAGLLAAADLDWISNVDDRWPGSAGPVQARTLLYQRAASMPVESMLIGNIHADLPTIQESFATAIGSAPLLLGDLRKLSVCDREWYQAKVSWFKKLRRSTKISESFFPLGNWLQPSSTAWDGFARLAHNGNGVIVIFRNKSNTSSAAVQLPLMPAGKWKMHSVISNKDLGVFTQSDWISGVSVKFSESDMVEILEVITTT